MFQHQQLYGGVSTSTRWTSTEDVLVRTDDLASPIFVENSLKCSGIICDTIALGSSRPDGNEFCTMDRHQELESEQLRRELTRYSIVLILWPGSAKDFPIGS